MTLDLIALVADVQQEKTLETLLRDRQASLGIRAISFRIFPHPRKDPGVYLESADFLAAYRPPQYDHALAILDREWDGTPGDPASIRRAIRERLCSNGWDDGNCEVIVIDPELETWVWSTSRWVPDVLRTTWEEIRGIARQGACWMEGEPKPHRPKILLETVLRRQGRPRSAAIFQSLAGRVSLKGCDDAAFSLLAATLRRWFPR